MIIFHISVTVPSLALWLFSSCLKYIYPLKFCDKSLLLPSTSLSYFIPPLFLPVFMALFFFIINISLTLFKNGGIFNAPWKCGAYKSDVSIFRTAKSSWTQIKSVIELI